MPLCCPPRGWKKMLWALIYVGGGGAEVFHSCPPGAVVLFTRMLWALWILAKEGRKAFLTLVFHIFNILCISKASSCFKLCVLSLFKPLLHYIHQHGSESLPMHRMVNNSPEIHGPACVKFSWWWLTWLTWRQFYITDPIYFKDRKDHHDNPV